MRAEDATSPAVRTAGDLEVGDDLWFTYPAGDRRHYVVREKPTAWHTIRVVAEYGSRITIDAENLGLEYLSVHRGGVRVGPGEGA